MCKKKKISTTIRVFPDGLRVLVAAAAVFIICDFSSAAVIYIKYHYIITVPIRIVSVYKSEVEVKYNIILNNNWMYNVR